MSNKTIKADSATDADAGKGQRTAAFRAWGTAEKGVTTALLACFLACAEYGQTDPREVAEARGWLEPNVDGEPVPNGSAKAYAATFNRAAKAAAIIGIRATRDLIEKAAKLPGRVHVNVGDALANVGREAKAGAVTKATAKEGRAIASAALKAATASATAAKADKAKPGKPRGTKSQDTATLGAASAESGQDWRANVAAVRLAANMATRLPMPEGREAAARAYLKALQDAAELGAALGA